MGRAAKARTGRPIRRNHTPQPILSLSIPTPIGRMHMAASERGLVRIELPGPEAHLRLNVWVALHFPHASIRCGVTPILKKAAGQIEAYFTAGLKQFSLPLHLAGTPFQVAVWQVVAQIPFAETRTYRDIAEAIERPKAVRAVGAAQGANPLPIVIPCHRVIGSDGSLTGYGGGVETKQWLLEHEADLEERSSAQPGRVPHLVPVPDAHHKPITRPAPRRPQPRV